MDIRYEIICGAVINERFKIIEVIENKDKSIAVNLKCIKCGNVMKTKLNKGNKTVRCTKCSNIVFLDIGKSINLVSYKDCVNKRRNVSND